MDGHQIQICWHISGAKTLKTMTVEISTLQCVYTCTTGVCISIDINMLDTSSPYKAYSIE